MDVGQLKEILNNLPDDMIIEADGADDGGYDVITGTNVFAVVREDKLYIAHEN